MVDLAVFLDTMTVEGDLVDSLPDKALRCTACGHRCLIREGRRGICQVRFNRDGRLYVPYGYVAALQVDPIEKKPFFHVLPGEAALTFGMLGCDFHCSYCQNHLTSQALRDPASDAAGALVQPVTPEQVAGLAVRYGAGVVASSYNEPLITSEWAAAIFRQAQAAGLKCAFISNGNATPEALAYLRPYLSAYKIDLKTMQDRQYRRLGGTLQRVLDSIRMAHAAGLWVEVVTLVVPGFNDSSAELLDAASYIRSVSADIPWHVTAFHPDYKMLEPSPTAAQALLQAAEIGQEAGLNFVYAGNLPGRVNEYENTYCPHCRALLIERRHFSIKHVRLAAGGKCPDCGQQIPGVWS